MNFSIFMSICNALLKCVSLFKQFFSIKTTTIKPRLSEHFIFRTIRINLHFMCTYFHKMFRCLSIRATNIKLKTHCMCIILNCVGGKAYNYNVNYDGSTRAQGTRLPANRPSPTGKPMTASWWNSEGPMGTGDSSWRRVKNFIEIK